MLKNSASGPSLVKKPTGTKPLLGGKTTKPVTSSNNNYSYLPPPITKLPSNNNITVGNLNQKNLRSPYDDFEDPLNEEVEDENSL